MENLNPLICTGHGGGRHDQLRSTCKSSNVTAVRAPSDCYSSSAYYQLFSQEESDAPVLPAGAALSRSGSLSYQPVHTGIGSHHTRAKLPKVDTSIGSPIEGTMGMHRINLNDEAYDSPEQAGPSRAFLPPGAASPTAVSPPNLNREFAPPPLPPRRPADVGSMHTRRPSYNATLPQGHADELGGTTYEPMSPATATTSPGTALGHSLIREDLPEDGESQIITEAVHSEMLDERTGNDTEETIRDAYAEKERPKDEAGAERAGLIDAQLIDDKGNPAQVKST